MFVRHSGQPVPACICALKGKGRAGASDGQGRRPCTRLFSGDPFLTASTTRTSCDRLETTKVGAGPQALPAGGHFFLSPLPLAIPQPPRFDAGHKGKHHAHIHRRTSGRHHRRSGQRSGAAARPAGVPRALQGAGGDQHHRVHRQLQSGGRADGDAVEGRRLHRCRYQAVPRFRRTPAGWRDGGHAERQ